MGGASGGTGAGRDVGWSTAASRTAALIVRVAGMGKPRGGLWLRGAGGGGEERGREPRWYGGGTERGETN